MQYNRNVYVVSQMIKDYEKKQGEYNQLTDTLAIQRPEGQWSNSDQSLLIHSILQGYGIPALWLFQADGKSFNPITILDGKQRITVTYNYITNGFKLSRNTPDVVLTVTNKDENGNIIYDENGNRATHKERYEIKNKKFCDLNCVLKEILMNFRYDTNMIVDATNEELEEQIFRLNNGKIPGATLKAFMKGGIDIAEAIKSKIICDNFFENRFLQTKTDLKNAEDMKCVFHTLMLLCNIPYTKLSGAKDLTSAAQMLKESWKNDTFTIENIDLCNDYFELLNEVLPEDDEFMLSEIITTTHVPVMIMNIDKFKALEEDEKINKQQYKQFMKYWVTEGFYKNDYQQYVNKDVSSKANVESRIDVMDRELDNFVDQYCQNESEESFTYEPKLIDMTKVADDFVKIYDNDVETAAKCLMACSGQKRLDFTIKGLNSFICTFNRKEYEKQIELIENTELCSSMIESSYNKDPYILSMYQDDKLDKGDNNEIFEEWLFIGNIDYDKQAITPAKISKVQTELRDKYINFYNERRGN